MSDEPIIIKPIEKEPRKRAPNVSEDEIKELVRQQVAQMEKSKERGFIDKASDVLDILLADDVKAPNMPEKIQKPSKPLFTQLHVSKPVYLILPEERTFHTSITEFLDGKKRKWYYLAFNKKIYGKDDVDFKTELTAQACNFIFLDGDEGERLVLADADFSPEAKTQIEQVDRMKLEDRCYEKSNMRMNRKYRKIEGVNVIVAILLICIGVFLVLWVVLGGLPGIIGAVNAAPSQVQAAAQAAAQPLATQNFTAGG